MFERSFTIPSPVTLIDFGSASFLKMPIFTQALVTFFGVVANFLMVPLNFAEFSASFEKTASSAR